MNIITEYLKENISDEDLEGISEKLIQAKLDRDKKQEWANRLKKDYGLEKEERGKLISFKSRKWMLLSIAASVLFIVGFFILSPALSSDSYTQMADKHIKQLSIMGDQSIIRKGLQEVESIRKEATLTYVKQKYDESLLLWQKIVATQEASGSDYFYQGLCLLQKTNPEPEESILVLRKSLSLDGPKEEIAWVLSLAYLKIGDKTKAMSELSKIVESKGYKHKEAAELLESL